MSERDPLGWLAVIAAMTVAVYITRAGGYWLIGRVTIGPRLRKMLDALPGAIIAATIAPLLAHGGVSALAAVTAALLAMIGLRNDFAAVASGLVAAALVRTAGF
jgi:branched chain amino acid efflux pump